MKREIGAFIKKGFFNLLSYRLSYFLRFLIVLLFLLSFYIFTHYFSKKSFVFHLEGYSVSYFLFILTGGIFSGCSTAVLKAFSTHMEEERRMGTLEALLVTPTNFSTITVATYIWSFIFVFIGMFPILLFGVYILKDNLISSDILAFTLTLLLSVILFGAISMLLTAFIITFEKGTSVTILVNNLFRILGGIYVPVIFLPKQLQIVSYCLPTTYSMNALRGVLFGGYTFMDIAPELITILTFSAILWPLSIVALSYTLRKAKEKGSLSHY